jgi:HSP20 family protein
MTKTLGSLMEVARIQSEINRLFDNLLDLGSGEEGAGGSWIPNADILESESELVVKIELPGVPAERLALSVTRGNLTVRGEKTRPDLAEARVQTAERPYGPFRRVIQLPIPVNTRQAHALLKNGLLRISFPKVPNRRGEEVPIEVHSA